MRARVVGPFVAGGLLLACLPAQEVLLRLTGAPGESFGHAVIGVGDTNLDGWVDLLVGAPDARGGGTARLFSGRDGALLREFAGKSAGQRMGESVAALGDVDRDGHPDFAVQDAREVQVFSGREGALLFSVAAGSGLARAGDVNADGHADLVVGYAAVLRDYRYQGGKGEAIVYSGRDGTVLHRFADSDVMRAFGVVGDGGDIDGDGYADVVVGAPGFGGPPSFDESGYMRVFSGRTGAVLREIRGAQGDAVGTAVASGFDLDNDGFDDVLVFASQEYVRRPGVRAGYCEIRSGRSGAVMQRQNGVVSCSRTWCDVVRPLVGPAFPLGDIDGDGVADYRVGDVYSGRTGERRCASRGTRAGDIDRDGLDDIAVGFPDENRVEVHAGVDRAMRYSFAGPLHWFMEEVQGIAVLGDADGDGAADFIVGTRNGYSDFINGALSTVRVLSGKTGALYGARILSRVEMIFPDVAVAPAGLLDGDAVPDVLVGWAGVNRRWGQQIIAYTLDATVLDAWDGFPHGFEGFGRVLVGGRDWDGDGRPDAFASGDTSGASPVGRGFVVELAPGGAFGRTFHGTSSGDAFGTSLAYADVDRDGLADLVIGAPGGDANGEDSGYVRVWSGRGGGALFWDLSGPGQGARFGTSVAAAGDLDGDGHEDFAVSAPGADVTQVLSGASAQLLLVLPDGGPLRGSGDADGDGVADLLVGDTVYSTRNGMAIASFARARLLADFTGDGRAEVIALGCAGPDRGDFDTFHVNSFVPLPRLSVFGHGCAGARGVPALRLGGNARPGGSVNVEAVRLRPSSVGALVLGSSRDAHSGIALPLPLAFAGMPDCVLWISLDLALGVHSDPSGYVQRTLSIPAIVDLAGAVWYQQLLLIDPEANAGGIVSSDAGRVGIGAR
jgi:hypothetical protein